MSEPQDQILEMAAAVADGASVDWDLAQSSTSGEELEALEQLRIIAEIAALHRRQAETDNRTLGSEGTAHRVSDLPVPSSAQREASQKWGPLMVLERLGGGSFGDVFRAFDPNLEREVALKLLKHSPRVGTDSIMREGQLLARIRHANVMAVYGAQEFGGQVGIWGELLRGRTLAQIVAENGPLSADETVVVADALCRALTAVHRAGMLHRDVKAKNVIRESGGRIVLMDFGLGRHVDRIPESGHGEMAGTPLYLAPELFAGGRASVQSDLYSLGVLLFFLVTGAYPVSGKTVSELADAHGRRRRQRLQDLRPDLPAAFVYAVEAALNADPAARPESSGALQAMLLSATAPPLNTIRGGQAHARPRWTALLTAAVAAGAVVGGIARWTAPRPPAPRAVTFPLTPPPDCRFSDSSREAGAISPDRRYVVFNATNVKTGEKRLWLHDLRSMTATAIPDSAAAQVFWAPDSTAFGFFTGDGLKRISITGVRADTVAAAAEPRGGTWNRDGMIVFAPDPSSGLFRTDATGVASKPTLVIAPSRGRGELGYMWPQFLPDGRRFVFFVFSNDDNVRGIYLSSLDATPVLRLAASDASAIVSRERLLFVRDGKLVGQKLDLAQGRLQGEAQTLIDGVATTFDHRSVVSASADGTLVYLPATASRLTWYERSGKSTPVEATPGRYRSPVISSDGRYVATQRYRDSLSEIVILDLARGGTIMTAIRGGDQPATQSPDIQFAAWAPGPHRRLAYASAERGWLDIYVRDLDSGRPAELLYASETDKTPNDWSPDGAYLAFTELSKTGSLDLWILPVSGDRPPYALLSGPASEGSGAFSPDGSHLAYVSGESGDLEVWVRAFPGGSSARMVSLGGGIDPHWASDTEVSFMDRSGRLLLANVGTGPAAEPPRPLFATGVVSPGASRNNYDWSPDRRRVLVNEPLPDTWETLPRVLIDWNPE